MSVHTAAVQRAGEFGLTKGTKITDCLVDRVELKKPVHGICISIDAIAFPHGQDVIRNAYLPFLPADANSTQKAQSMQLTGGRGYR